MCEECMGADEVRWSNLLPFLFPKHVFVKGLWLLCFTKKPPRLFPSAWKCRVIVTSSRGTGSPIRTAAFWITWNTDFSHGSCYPTLEPHTLGVLGAWQSVRPWFVCFPNDFYTHSSPGCASSINSMKAHESQSTTLSHALELCELSLNLVL